MLLSLDGLAAASKNAVGVTQGSFIAGGVRTSVARVFRCKEFREVVYILVPKTHMFLQGIHPRGLEEVWLDTYRQMRLSKHEVRYIQNPRGKSYRGKTPADLQFNTHGMGTKTFFSNFLNLDRLDEIRQTFRIDGGHDPLHSDIMFDSDPFTPPTGRGAPPPKTRYVRQSLLLSQLLSDRCAVSTFIT
jgi:hypothetical protein